jgi:hypothetical protein
MRMAARFLSALAFAVLVAAVLAYLPDAYGQWPKGGAPPGAVDHLTSINYGTPYKYNQGYPGKYATGDSWAFTWADNGTLYTLCNDCFGANDSIANGRDTAWLSSSTSDTSTTLTNLNSMDAYSNRQAALGSDGLAIKGWGNISVHGTIYMMTTRFNYQNTTPPYRSVSSGGQIIKTTNHGATTGGPAGWNPVPPATNEPFASPMWPGTFGSLWFVQYDKQDYVGQTWDGSDTYVYAVMPTTAWNNDSNLYLARVTIANLLANCCSAASAADWAWYQGGGDGTNPANWGAIGTRVAILSVSNQIGATGPQYLPFCTCYVMFQWNYPSIPGSFVTSTTNWYAYTAQHVWGPWTLIDTHTWTPGAYYDPAVNPKSLVSGGRSLMVTTAGDFQDPNGANNTNYTMTLIPVTLQ